MISKETKTAIIAEYKINENDTGSPEVQVAILTDRINSNDFIAGNGRATAGKTH